MTGNPTPTRPTQNGFAIRAFREKEGRSVQWLADQVLITAPHLRNLENEHRNASDEHLNAIARALDVPTAALRRIDSLEREQRRLRKRPTTNA
ncbi:hypothetical protein GCM10027418_06340 [Mariniluteicoccus endophyticus]